MISYLKNKRLKMGEENIISCKFRWLDFKITSRCNNHCLYCGIKNDHPSAPEKLSFHIIKRTLDVQVYYIHNQH